MNFDHVFIYQYKIMFRDLKLHKLMSSVNKKKKLVRVILPDKFVPRPDFEPDRVGFVNFLAHTVLPLRYQVSYNSLFNFYSFV